MVAVVLVATDLAGATNLAIDIRVGPFAPEESKKNEGGSCLTGRDLPLPLQRCAQRALAVGAGCWPPSIRCAPCAVPLCAVCRIGLAD